MDGGVVKNKGDNFCGKHQTPTTLHEQAIAKKDTFQR